MPISQVGSYRQQGYTYLMVLIAIVTLSVTAMVVTRTTSSLTRADQEAELLFRGQAYRNAIASYYRAGRLHKEYPRSLKDLLKDPRYPNRHHIRRLYDDPTGDHLDWILIQAPDGGIMGVASQTDQPPLRKTRFPPVLEYFQEASSYREWQFTWQPKVLTPSQKSELTKN